MTLPRLYPILCTSALERCGVSPVAAAKAMLAGGAQILQFRHKGHFSREMFEQAKAVAKLAAGIPFVMNDRVDLAMLLDAGAVHLGQEDLPAAEARKLTAMPIGLSTHNREQLLDANRQPADYHALGPVFATASKENADAALGLAEWQELRHLSTRPLVAIGGITLANAGAVMQAGADSVAVIGALMGGTPEEIRARTEEWIEELNP